MPTALPRPRRLKCRLAALQVKEACQAAYFDIKGSCLTSSHLTVLVAGMLYLGMPAPEKQRELIDISCALQWHAFTLQEPGLC